MGVVVVVVCDDGRHHARKQNIFRIGTYSNTPFTAPLPSLRILTCLSSSTISDWAHTACDRILFLFSRQKNRHGVVVVKRSKDPSHKTATPSFSFFSFLATLARHKVSCKIATRKHHESTATISAAISAVIFGFGDSIFDSIDSSSVNLIRRFIVHLLIRCTATVSTWRRLRSTVCLVWQGSTSPK